MSRTRTPRRSRGQSSRPREPGDRQLRALELVCPNFVGTIPSTSIPASSKRSRAWISRYCRGSVPIKRKRAPVAWWMRGHARSSVGNPLRGSWRPMKTTVWSRSAGSALSGMRTPLGSPGSRRDPAGRRFGGHRRHGDPDVDAVHQKAPEMQRGPHPPEIAVCVVGDDDRALRVASAATQIAGVIGSCRCTTSNCSSASTRRTRATERGDRTMLGSEPLAGTTTDRPTGMIPRAAARGGRFAGGAGGSAGRVGHCPSGSSRRGRADVAPRTDARRVRRPRPSTTRKTER